MKEYLYEKGERVSLILKTTTVHRREHKNEYVAFFLTYTTARTPRGNDGILAHLKCSSAPLCQENHWNGRRGLKEQYNSYSSHSLFRTSRVRQFAYIERMESIWDGYYFLYLFIKETEA